MEISRSGVGRRAVNARRKAATKKAASRKSTAAKAKAKIESMRKRLGIKAKPKATPKSTAGGRNRTALRTPKGAGSVAKNKPVAKKKTTAKRKSSGPAPLPKTMVGRQSFGEVLKEKGPGAALDAGLIASLLLTRGRGPLGAKGKGALSRTMTRLKDTFKPKPSTPGRRKATPTEKAKTKRTEEGYDKFEADRKERSRKRARGRR